MSQPSIPGYTIVKKIAEGGCAEIFKARKQPYDNNVALKVLHSRHMGNKRMIKAFDQEASMLARLDHKNIIKFGRIVVGASRPTLELELFESVHLKRMILKPEEFALTVPDKAQILIQVAAALEYVHSFQIAHKDLKPENVLVKDVDQVKLIDFSIATELKTGFLARLFQKEPPPEGTPTYLSPEQIRGKGVDTRSDIYSFGIVAFQLFTGTPPITSNTAQGLLKAHLSEKPAALGPRCKELSKEAASFIDRCLLKDPEHRPQTIGLVSAALAKCC